jgi:hypothetical protein
VKVECKKRPGVKGNVGPPGALVPATPAPRASYGKTQNLAGLGRMSVGQGFFLFGGAGV